MTVARATCGAFTSMSFVFSSRRRHTRSTRDWSSDVCSSDLVAVVVSAAVIALAGLATARAAESYHQLKKYNFPAAEGRTREYFDYIMVDSAARRVYLSHGTEIKVIDADNGSVVGTIGGLKLTHGVAVAD